MKCEEMMTCEQYERFKAWKGTVHVEEAVRKWKSGVCAWDVGARIQYSVPRYFGDLPYSKLIDIVIDDPETMFYHKGELAGEDHDGRGPLYHALFTCNEDGCSGALGPEHVVCKEPTLKRKRKSVRLQSKSSK